MQVSSTEKTQKLRNKELVSCTLDLLYAVRLLLANKQHVKPATASWWWTASSIYLTFSLYLPVIILPFVWRARHTKPVNRFSSLATCKRLLKTRLTDQSITQSPSCLSIIHGRPRFIDRWWQQATRWTITDSLSQRQSGTEWSTKWNQFGWLLTSNTRLTCTVFIIYAQRQLSPLASREITWRQRELF